MKKSLKTLFTAKNIIAKFQIINLLLRLQVFNINILY